MVCLLLMVINLQDIYDQKVIENQEELKKDIHMQVIWVWIKLLLKILKYLKNMNMMVNII